MQEEKDLSRVESLTLSDQGELPQSYGGHYTPPEHDAVCERELTSHGYTPCRCAERRAGDVVDLRVVFCHNCEPDEDGHRPEMLPQGSWPVHVCPTCDSHVRVLTETLVIDPARIATDIVQRVAELPDRTSPEGWPDAMLVTADELTGIVRALLAAKRVARDRVTPDA